MGVLLWIAIIKNNADLKRFKRKSWKSTWKFKTNLTTLKNNCLKASDLIKVIYYYHYTSTEFSGHNKTYPFTDISAQVV